LISEKSKDAVISMPRLNDSWRYELWTGTNLGHMRGIAYDTAQVARLRNGSTFPRALVWLISSQREDGSWGEDHPYMHDRIISTLASVVTLAENDKRKFENRIKAGMEYLWQNSEKIKGEEYSTVGFEIIYPSLVGEAIDLGLDIPTRDREYYEKLKDDKIRPILADALYSGKTTLTFSAEFMGGTIDRARARGLFSKSGSVGNSPSATAYLLRYVNSKKAKSYIIEVEKANNNGSIADVYPFEIFERAWMMYNFLVSGATLTDHALLNLEYLKSCMKPAGVGISKMNSIPDSDSSAVTLAVLSSYKLPADPRVLELFESNDRFLCFYFERDPSVSANIHILDALQRCGRTAKTEQGIEKILRFLKKKVRPGGYWLDKWHLSPYYATAHAIFATANVDLPMAGKAVDWITSSQKPDGSWGLNRGSAEETAYAIQGLLHYNRLEKIDLQPALKGLEYISNHDCSASVMQALWIGKGLYAPERVIKSTVNSAFEMFRNSRK
jgi:halimadienyl-diphosphate synthase